MVHLRKEKPFYYLYHTYKVLNTDINNKSKYYFKNKKKTCKY